MFRKTFGIVIFLSVVFFSISSEAATETGSLVDEFMNYTEIQQEGYAKRIEGRINVYHSGVVGEVRETNFLDPVEGYYVVLYNLKRSPNNHLYRIYLCFSTKNKVMHIPKDVKIAGEGKLLKIIDMGLVVNV